MFVNWAQVSQGFILFHCTRTGPLFVWVHMYVRVYICVCACVYMHKRRSKDTLRCHPQKHHLSPLRWSFHWSGIHKLGWTGWPQGASCSEFPSAWIANVCHHTWASGQTCLQGKFFTSWGLLPASQRFLYSFVYLQILARIQEAQDIMSNLGYLTYEVLQMAFIGWTSF